MNRARLAVALVAAGVFIGHSGPFSEAASAADLPGYTKAPQAPPATVGPASCTGPTDFLLTDCSLTYYGVTVYGIIDMGVGYETHGAPFNPNIISGVQELIRKNSTGAKWLPTPGGLSQSFIGVKGREHVAQGLDFVFDLSFGFDPYSMTAANGPKSFLDNNGVPLAQQTSNADSSRAGQFYNGTGYAGLSSASFGTLTFGRQNSLTLDGVISYDPMGASYAFSVIGWQGIAAGAGDTEDARLSTAVKYRGDVGGLFRVAALAQLGGYELNNGTQAAYSAGVGKDFDWGAYGKLSVDAIYAFNKGAVASSSLSAAQNALYPGTIAATISDNTGVMLLAKYTYRQIKLFAGYENIRFANPTSPLTSGFTNIAGIPVVFPTIVQNAYTNNEILDIMWVGGRYAFTETFDAGLAYYHYNQNSYFTTYCNTTAHSQCAGTLDAVSFNVDWKFAKKFDAYAGFMYSQVNHGLASGYFFNNNFAPTAGVRFRF